MDNLLVYVAYALTAFTSVIALAFFISRTKLQEKVRNLEEKLTVEQARRAEIQVNQAATKKKAEPTKPSAENNKHAAELTELRKQTANLKDEVKHLKTELRTSDSHNKDLQTRIENETFKLRAENQALIERLRELESNSPDKKKALSLEQELNELKPQFKTIQSELVAANAKLKSERATAERQKQQLDATQQQLRELRAKLPDESAPTEERVDPKVLMRWKERALTARQMYQMMRQMRELSDLKLSTYQEAVIDVSRTLLTLKGASSPEIGPRENKADRYLAEAWSLIQPENLPNDASANP